jgi:hypothetical protein
MVVGVERMLVVFLALSVSVMVLRVSEKLTNWSEGASVMSTGRVAVAPVARFPVEGATELEHPRMRPAARPRVIALAKMRLKGMVAFIGVSGVRLESQGAKLSGGIDAGLGGWITGG